MLQYKAFCISNFVVPITTLPVVSVEFFRCGFKISHRHSISLRIKLEPTPPPSLQSHNRNRNQLTVVH